MKPKRDSTTDTLIRKDHSMETQTIWTILRDQAVEVFCVCLAAIARNQAENPSRWSAALGELVRNAGKGIST
jgi:hypothetical protein